MNLKSCLMAASLCLVAGIAFAQGPEFPSPYFRGPQLFGAQLPGCDADSPRRRTGQPRAAHQWCRDCSGSRGLHHHRPGTGRGSDALG